MVEIKDILQVIKNKLQASYRSLLLEKIIYCITDNLEINHN